MKQIWIIIQFIVTAPLWFPLLLWIVSRFKKTSGKSKTFAADQPLADIGVIVTAYQQIDLIPSVVQSILKSNYDNYLIYVVADDCDISGLSFSSEKVVILRPEQKLASNTKSHFYAIQNFKRQHDVITIIDSDNIVEPNYLSEIAATIKAGFEAVQGVRAARNLNTTYACLDEAGDMFYRFIDRKLLFEAGSSASLAGSGMAFKTDTFKEMLADFDISGAGFDKYLQYELVRRKKRIAFTMDAVVYDGKTSGAEQLVKQRARWINTWFKYWSLAIALFFKSIFNFNWNQFAFSMMLLRPPLFILGFAGMLCIIINLFVSPELLVIWLCSIVIFCFLFAGALRTFNASRSIYQALVRLPKFVYLQVLALFKARAANKISVATKHDVSAYKNDYYETDRN
ncbi:glycosyltransferase [Niabella insulamsoli]|uniref:glycosyltransferase n=1 Tax=Niabella insulamsoli TaxID=3144874 RepID=UPI0031FC4C73